jgi:hypothetical protein
LSTASWPLSQYLHFCRQVYLDHIPPSHSTARGCLQFHSRLEGTDPLATMPEQSRVTSQHHPYLARGPTRGLDRRQNEPEEINVALIGTLETRLGHEHEEKAQVCHLLPNCSRSRQQLKDRAKKSLLQRIASCFSSSWLRLDLVNGSSAI